MKHKHKHTHTHADADAQAEHRSEIQSTAPGTGLRRTPPGWARRGARNSSVLTPAVHHVVLPLPFVPAPCTPTHATHQPRNQHTASSTRCTGMPARHTCARRQRGVQHHDNRKSSARHQRVISTLPASYQQHVSSMSAACQHHISATGEQVRTACWCWGRSTRPAPS